MPAFRYRKRWGPLLGALLVTAACATQRVPVTLPPALSEPPKTEIGARLRARLDDALTRLAIKLVNTRIAFGTSLGNNSQLALFDRELNDVWVFPGAGLGVATPFEVARELFLYQANNAIFLYDAHLEERILLFDPRMVGGFAFLPLPTVFRDLYVLGIDDPVLAARGLGLLYCFPKDVIAGRPRKGVGLLRSLTQRHPLLVQTLKGLFSGTATESADLGDALTGQLASVLERLAERPSSLPYALGASLIRGMEGLQGDGTGAGDEDGFDEDIFGEEAEATSDATASPSVMPATSQATGSPAIQQIPPWWFYTSKPIFLSKINAVAVKHGFIQSYFINPTASTIVFTTGDGSLFLYDDVAQAVVEVRTNREFGQGQAAFCTISQFYDRYIAWEDRVLRQVFVLDRFRGAIDVVPYPNLLAEEISTKTVLAMVPFFYGLDPYHLYLTVIFADGTFRTFEYALETQTIVNLTLLNNFLVPPVVLSSGFDPVRR